MIEALVAADPTGGIASSSGPALVFAVLVGGGLFAGVAKLINARTSAKKVKLENDPHSPRVAIGGAETAVTLMDITLKSLQKENGRLVTRVEDLETAVTSRDKHIKKQDDELAEQRVLIEQQREQIDALTESVQVLNERLGIAPV